MPNKRYTLTGTHTDSITQQIQVGFAVHTY